MPASKRSRVISMYSHYHADEGGNNVLLKKMVLVVDGRPDIELDLTGKLKF